VRAFQVRPVEVWVRRRLASRTMALEPSRTVTLSRPRRVWAGRRARKKKNRSATRLIFIGY
jgi:hypothetical protein